jgi:hypothetical protein
VTPPEGRNGVPSDATRPAKCSAHFSDHTRCCSVVRHACISRFIASGHSARAAACTEGEFKQTDVNAHSFCQAALRGLMAFNPRFLSQLCKLACVV